MLGVIGRGYWGDTYCKVLRKLKIPHWQDGRYWHMRHADAVIVATSTESHYEVARTALGRKIPVLLEKPACTTSDDVKRLLDLGGTCFVAHTRLYSPAWRAFRRPATSVQAFAGGVNASNPNAYWNWAPHLLALGFDLGCVPEMQITDETQPLRIIADGREFVDEDKTVLEVLIREFLAGSGNADLQLALKIIEHMEKECPWRTTRH